jgi:flavin-binding protein dodecin
MTTKGLDEDKERVMSVARVTEIISSSKKGFDDAVAVGIKRASQTLKNVTAAWVASQEAMVDNGQVTEYRVRLKVTFILKP